MTQMMTFARAGGLLKTYRPSILHHPGAPALARVSARETNQDVGLTHDGVLIITGSNNLKDYLWYNLRPLRTLSRFRKLPELDRLTSELLPVHAYHGGFLLHAARVLQFLGRDRPSFIIGHSLGAASAQILGTALNVPTIAFASPQVVKRRFLKAAPFREADHPQWAVFNIAWKQDLVARGYRQTGLRCLGHRKLLDMECWNLGIAHFVEDYLRLLEGDASKGPARAVPEHWRVPGYPLPERLV